ncbi:energy transducer TonB [Undibacterium sp. FT79W]|nr:energy transducer TonB [Undibacterium sp. FT79W]
MSLRNGEIGTVGLMFLIEPDGTVAHALNRISSGYPLLDFSALDNAKLCKFKPATLNGVPQRGWAYANFDFKLPD